MDSQARAGDRVEAPARLSGFRSGLYSCLSARPDALFELADAVLCSSGPVTSLVEPCQDKAFRRGHGALYDALACGQVDAARLRWLLIASWTPADAGPVKIAIDVSPWKRPDAETSPQRCHAHASCRRDGVRKTIPGWPFSLAAGLQWGATSWTTPLDAVRIAPADDPTVVSVEQVQRVAAGLAEAGTPAGRPAPLFVFDAGYDLTRISHLLARAGTGVQILGRVRCDRVYYARVAGPGGRMGRPPRHGARFELVKNAVRPAPTQTLTARGPRYGKVEVSAWHALHQKLARHGGWSEHAGDLPIVEGSLIRIQVEHLPGNRTPKDLWLWHTAPEGTAFDLDLLGKAYLRRLDLEHTFRFARQHPGWTVPQIRTPEQGERWTWPILAAHTQLRLAATLTTDLRRPREKPIPTGRPITPGRVRRGFANLRKTVGTPARTPKPTHPGPGRPKGTTRPPRTRYPVGKNQPKADTTPSDAMSATG